MKRLTVFLAIGLISAGLSPVDARAQGQDQEDAAERLAWFAGEWTFDHLSGGSQCNLLGRLIVHCQGQWTNADGDPVEAVFITRYDAANGLYRAHRFYSNGYGDNALGWVDGDQWTFVYEGREGARFRFSAMASGDKWSYEWHRSLQGGDWEPMASGSMTRVR